MSKTRTELLRELSESFLENAKLQESIDKSERDLVKHKTPQEIFGKSEWFKIDRIGAKAFIDMCYKVRETENKKYGLEDRIRQHELLLREIGNSNISKKSLKNILERLKEWNEEPVIEETIRNKFFRKND